MRFAALLTSGGSRRLVVLKCFLVKRKAREVLCSSFKKYVEQARLWESTRIPLRNGTYCIRPSVGKHGLLYSYSPAAEGTGCDMQRGPDACGFSEGYGRS